MSVYRNGKYYHYEFAIDGRRYRASTRKTLKQAAEAAAARWAKVAKED